MPLVEKINTNTGILGIWKLTESYTKLELLFQFTENEKEEFSKIKADQRKKEYIAARLLLQEILTEKNEIKYHKSGKPLLEKIQKNISISHSSDFVVVFISEQKIGIDIENTKREIKKIASRFLHKKESKHILSLENQQTVTILYWSAKEAIFKCSEEHGIQFNSQISIPPFEIKDKGNFTGILNQNNHYKLWYFFYENNVIVYCVEDNTLQTLHHTNK